MSIGNRGLPRCAEAFSGWRSTSWTTWRTLFEPPLDVEGVRCWGPLDEQPAQFELGIASSQRGAALHQQRGRSGNRRCRLNLTRRCWHRSVRV